MPSLDDFPMTFPPGRLDRYLLGSQGSPASRKTKEPQIPLSLPPGPPGRAGALGLGSVPSLAGTMGFAEANKGSHSFPPAIIADSRAPKPPAAPKSRSANCWVRGPTLTGCAGLVPGDSHPRPSALMRLCGDGTWSWCAW